MSETSPNAEVFLAALKTQGRSSPAGIAWAEFHRFLAQKRMADQPAPPVPLILAASGASNATKHERLAEQLKWADMNAILDEAIRYLEAIPTERWNVGSLESWTRENYP